MKDLREICDFLPTILSTLEQNVRNVCWLFRCVEVQLINNHRINVRKKDWTDRRTNERTYTSLARPLIYVLRYTRGQLLFLRKRYKIEVLRNAHMQFTLQPRDATTQF